jgi:uncharacterized membrane protein YtjA (UPF0391 family)
MERYAAAFLAAALVAALFGFTDRSALLASIARDVCLLFVLLFAAAAIGSLGARCARASRRKLCATR